jgi:hypothetical protein
VKLWDGAVRCESKRVMVGWSSGVFPRSYDKHSRGVMGERYSPHSPPPSAAP